MPRSTRKIVPRLLYLTLILIILIAQLARVESLQYRWFCVDEFEHLHAAWCMTPAGGSLVPYRDFFEHHTPLLYALLAPFLAITRPALSYDNALHAIFLSRWIMYALGCLILYLTYKLGRQLGSQLAGLMAVLFTLSTMMFLDRTLEIRPDLLSTPCMLATLLLTLGPTRRSLFFGGILSALAILATPKSLFYLDGYGLALLYVLYQRKSLKLLLSWFFGLALPILATLAAFAFFHGAAEFITHNFLLNASWKFRLDPWQTIGELAYENPLLVAFGSAGLLAASIAVITRQRSPLVPLTTAALIAGIFIIPVPYTEYFVPLIPLLAIFQASAILDITSWLKRQLPPRRLPSLTSPQPASSVLSYRSPRVKRSSFRSWLPFVVQLSLGFALLAFILLRLRPPFTESSVELLAWLPALAAAILLLRKNHRHLALCLLLTMMTLFPARRFLAWLPRSDRHPARVSPNNLDQLHALRYIHAHTSPGDHIFDGWQHITAPFRPHAFHYFFLHREIRPMLPQSTYDQLLRDLRSKTINPTIVIMDQDTRSLPKPIVDYFEQYYRPTEIDYIWARSQP